MDRIKKQTKLIACASLALILKSNFLFTEAVAGGGGTMAHTEKMSNGTNTMSMTQEGKSANNINQALQEALDTNPEILFQKAEREATRHKVTQAKGNYLPSVTIRSGAGREYVSQKFVASTGTATGLSSAVNANHNQSRYDPSIKLTQRLFDGTETINDVKKVKNEFIQSTKNVSEAQTLVAFSVFDAYIAVRRFERLHKLAQENIRVHESILGKMRKLVEAGKAASGDEESVRSRLFDAKAALSDIEGDLMTAHANFKEVTGVEAHKLNRPNLPETQVPKTLKEAVAKSRDHNKSVIVARATESVSKSDFDKTIAPFMPRFDLELEARRSFNVSGKTGHETNMIGQVVGTFNIFNGGKDIGRRREFRARMASAKFQTQREIRRAEKETRVSYAEMVSARKQSTELRKAVGSKQNVRDGYMKQFEAGTRSFVDILDASHEYFLAKGSLITADATGDLAIARLFASMGMLLDLYKAVVIRDDMQHLGTDGHMRGKTHHNTPKKAAMTVAQAKPEMKKRYTAKSSYRDYVFAAKAKAKVNRNRT